MRCMLSPRRFTTTVALLVSLALAAPPAYADWDDNSGSLPGMGSLGSAILIGAAAGGALVLMTLLRRGPVRAEPSRLDLGSTAGSGTITLVNRGKKPVSVVDLDLRTAGTFSLEPIPQLPAQLQPDESLTITVRFAPTTTGKHSSDLVVITREDGGKDRSMRVKVRGTSRQAESVARAG